MSLIAAVDKVRDLLEEQEQDSRAKGAARAPYKGSTND
jgi:hypothetical protein